MRGGETSEATLFDVAGIGNASKTERHALSNQFPDADADHAYQAALR